MVNYLNTVIEFKNLSNDLTIIKSYEGKVDQQLVKKITEEIEGYFSIPGNEFKNSKKVFHVAVEMLQNICKHSETSEPKVSNIGEGVFVLASDENKYYIRGGNISNLDDANIVINKLNEFNPLDLDELKVKYRELIKASRISEKGGAGLGLIDIIKKTKNKVDYKTIPIDSKHTFFIQESSVDII